MVSLLLVSLSLFGCDYKLYCRQDRDCTNSGYGDFCNAAHQCDITCSGDSDERKTDEDNCGACGDICEGVCSNGVCWKMCIRNGEGRFFSPSDESFKSDNDNCGNYSVTYIYKRHGLHYRLC